jgi:uncharacterized protein (TIGR02001 family)
MHAIALLGHARAHTQAFATALVLGIMAGAANSASAQTQESTTSGSINLGARGGLVGGDPMRMNVPDSPENPFEFSARAGFATDYIYRGTTLSARKPAVGAAFEVIALGLFYANASMASVKLPSQPSSEITMGGGIRPKLGEINFDFGFTRFIYPGETPPPETTAGIEYWEAVARADTKFAEFLHVAGGFAFSPNVSNTGAWSKYAAFGLGLDVPSKLLPPDVSVSLTSVVGYSWFGYQSVQLGGFPLPAYLNWNAGVTFSRKRLNLDLRYHDTNLSKENCFVFTGDPGAVPGGSIDPIRNPEGLMSGWCSATFVAKFWFSLN